EGLMKRRTALQLCFAPLLSAQSSVIIAKKKSGGGGGTTSRQFTSSTDTLSNSTFYLNNATSFTIAFWFKSGGTAQTNCYVSISQTNFGNQVAVIYGFASS